PLEIGRGAPPRAPGADRGFVNGGLALQVRLGALVAVTQPSFDTRLKYDPEYFGKKDRVIAGRNAAAYLDARWRYAELFFGSLSRNWGPPQLGLLVEYDQNVQVNSLLGADLETQLAGLTVFGQVLIDDVQIDRRTQADSEPPSYGVTLGAQGAVGGVSWTAYYTRVTNLTYRT